MALLLDILAAVCTTAMNHYQTNVIVFVQSMHTALAFALFKDVTSLPGHNLALAQIRLTPP